MDEDQQQDDQQEEKQEEQQPIAPSAFTSFNITPVRRPISSLALFQRQSAENDEQIRGVVRKNQEAKILILAERCDLVDKFAFLISNQRLQKCIKN